ncbi:MAG TPA: IS30 family transposase [Bdellovibrionales bacterium]|nr:IS30 family transposase [Bdellovibrionales bacterium]HCM41629.1 IS30 family transposase [Bdellovibrionales bacterium]
MSREIRRNRPGGRLYRAAKAAQRAESLRINQHPRHKISGSVEKDLVASLKLGWSPEQISGRWKQNGIAITHETIYQFIYRKSQKEEQNLYLFLPRKRKRRRSHATHKKHVLAGKRLNLPSIEDRPEIVDTRSRLGDFERDSIVSPRRQGSGILTIVDRKSRLTRIGKLPTLDSNDAHRLTVSLLKGLPIHTITNDNGPEFSMYEQTSKLLGADIFFSKPYSSWQRGTNENTNGLIRRFFPKGTHFNSVSEKDIRAVEKLLNSRPRKCLGFRTPLEVHNESVGCCNEF